MNGVDHPQHYQSGNGIEVIQVVEAYRLGFHLGNVIKYVLRCEKKGATIEDLEKAKWYLQREIDIRSGAIKELDKIQLEQADEHRSCKTL